MATQSSIFGWTNSMDRGSWWTTVHGVAKSDMTGHSSEAEAYFCKSITFFFKVHTFYQLA